MPERSFGRTVRYRRTKLGLSQAQLAELVGRSTASVRAWERDKSRPNDTKVIAALSAILGVSERQMFEKADVVPPTPSAEPDATLEQTLAELSPTGEDPATGGDDDDDRTALLVGPSGDDAESGVDAEPVIELDLEPEPGLDGDPVAEPGEGDTDDADVDADAPVVAAALTGAASDPAYVAPTDNYVTTPLTPTLSDLSYMEDRSQRQLYRVRTLATLVALVALVVAFLWAVGEGLGALGDWWNEFFGNLRL